MKCGFFSGTIAVGDAGKNFRAAALLFLLISKISSVVSQVGTLPSVSGNKKIRPVSLTKGRRRSNRKLRRNGVMAESANRFRVSKSTSNSGFINTAERVFAVDFRKAINFTAFIFLRFAAVAQGRVLPEGRRGPTRADFPQRL
jgi:hypothetical protein